ncbi:MAG: hypothetical protein Fur002_16930 [Anaerolineales bacterium]
MNAHARYMEQSIWTRELRGYLFERAGLPRARRVLEVGCGTGAILSQTPESHAARFGLDVDRAALGEAKLHAENAALTRGDALQLPYANQSFDIAYCHYLLLWVQNPRQALQEMARVSRCVIAFAEPDYSQRVDAPAALAPLGAWQTESLRRQGANPAFGGQLAQTFFEAGIKIEEAGEIRPKNEARRLDGLEKEWAAMESDLRGIFADGEIRQMKDLDAQARQKFERVLYVPTFFAWGWSEV